MPPVLSVVRMGSLRGCLSPVLSVVWMGSSVSCVVDSSVGIGRDGGVCLSSGSMGVC